MQRFWSRRDFLFQSGGGISGLALLSLLDQDGLLAANCSTAARRQSYALNSRISSRARRASSRCS